MDKKLNDALRRMLVCPISKQALIPATTEQDEAIRAIKGLDLATADRNTVYLVTQNKRWAYPVVNGLAWLMEGARIDLK